MAVLNFAEGEYGDNYDFTLRNEDATHSLADLTGYTAATLTITTPDFSTIVLNAKTLSLPGSSVARWAMADGDTNYNGDYVAQITLTGTGKRKRTFHFSVSVTKAL